MKSYFFMNIFFMKYFFMNLYCFLHHVHVVNLLLSIVVATVKWQSICSSCLELHGGDRSPNDPVILLVTRFQYMWRRS